MKRSFQCAFGTAALLLSSSAWAQDFSAKGQLAISAERLFGFYHDSATTTVGGVENTAKSDSFTLLSSPVPLNGSARNWSYGLPRVAGDYFIIDHLSLGAALGYSHISINVPGGGNTTVSTSGDSFLFAPRVGYAFAFNNIVGIWPRAGFTYRTLSSGDNSAHDLALTLEVPFVFCVIPHVAFWGGPTLDIGLSGGASNTNGGVTTTVDFNSTEFGLQTGLVAYFDL
jgi:Autotransporter beta-domain